MIGRIGRALWTRSPQDLWASLTRQRGANLATAQPAGGAGGYHQWLLGEFHGFIAATYPDTALPRERFMQLIGQYQDRDWLRRTNRYIGDLWYLFAPDFARRLPEYYRYTDLQLTLTLLTYATNDALLTANYLEPYAVAKRRFGRFSILELGAGIPHGFLHSVYKDGPAFCERVTTVDIDGVPARFVEYFCRRHGIAHRWVVAAAGTAAPLDAIGTFDFVFAKDVFEHLLDPASAIRDVIRCASDRALLALDLDDKGAAVYQHVSPTLAPLAAPVQAAGFALLQHTGNMSIFQSTKAAA